MNRRQRTRGITPPLVVLIGALIAGSELPTTAAPSTEQLKVADLDLTLKDLTGKNVRLIEFKGKVIVLNLWATWCRPCREEIPDLIKLQARYSNDVAVIGIVVQDKFGEKVRTFAQEFGIPYPILDGNDQHEFDKSFGPFWGLPTSILIDRDGRIRKKHQSQITLQQLEREVVPLIDARVQR